ncbi:MAG: flagellar hook-associated protein FlgK [Myxococcota bacterium]
MASMNEILTIGNSGLLASKSLLQMAGFNIANANTPGYARRSAQLQAQAVLGMGVSVQGPHAVRNELMARHLNTTYGDKGFHEGQLSGLNLVQEAFNDLDGVGLGRALNTFEDALAGLAGNPAGNTERQAVLNAATALGSSFSATRAQLQDGVDSSSAQANALAFDVSSKAQQVAALNNRIRALTDNGKDIGGLIDQRAALISDISAQMNVQSVQQIDGSVLLYAGGGRPLVSAEGASQVKINHQGPAGGFQSEVIFEKVNGEELVALQPVGGKIGGLLDSNNQVIAPTLVKIDELAEAFVNAFNAQHQAGFDFNGAAGGDFFSPIVAGVPAASQITLSAGVQGNPENVAASGNPLDVPGDNANGLLLEGIIRLPGLLPTGESAFDYYSDMVIDVSSSKQAASVGLEIETGSVAQLETMLESEVGVSVDEELIRMTKANQSFEAASQVIRNADQMSETVLTLLG